MNPVSRIIAAVVAVSVLLGAFFFGLVILVVLVAVFTLFAVGFWIRSWWLSRRPANRSVIKTRTEPDGNEIDAEYTVVSRRRD